jgi:hypothetical protein
MSIYSWIEQSTVTLSWICLTLACIFFFRRRFHQRVPEFTTFIVFSTFGNWVINSYYFMYQVYHFRSLTYFYIYWGFIVIQDALQLLTIYAIFLTLLRKCSSRQRIRGYIVPTLVLCLITASIANFLGSQWSDWRLTKRLEFLQQNFTVLGCTLLCFIACASLLMPLSWERPLKGIFAGFGLDYASRLLAYTLGVYRPGASMLWPLGRVLAVVAELAAPVFWLIVFLFPRRDSNDMNCASQGFEFLFPILQGWTNSIEAIVHHYRSKVRMDLRRLLIGSTGTIQNGDLDV